MANPEHLEILERGIFVWNRWRRKDRNTCPDLSGEILSLFIKPTGVQGDCWNLSGANLAGADLERINLDHADFSGADLTETRLAGARLTGADFTGAKLEGVDFTGAELDGALFDPGAAPTVDEISR